MKQPRKKGFTLIEMMVATSIFVIVAFIVSTVFISSMDAYKKSQNMKRIMENLNFALDTMTLKIREGKNHTSVVSSEIRLEYQEADGTKKIVIYKMESEKIRECIGSSLIAPCNDLTSPEVKITALSFKIIEDLNARRLIRVVIKGEANQEGGDKSPFTIQTTLSQRNSDNS